MRFAEAGRAQEKDILGLADEVASGQVRNVFAVNGRIETPVEIFECLRPRKSAALVGRSIIRRWRGFALPAVTSMWPARWKTSSHLRRSISAVRNPASPPMAIMARIAVMRRDLAQDLASD